MTHQLLFVTQRHHHGNARDEVGRLLSHLGRAIVEAPLDRTADLRQERLGALTERIHHRAKTRQHHFGIIRHLFLKSVENAIDKLLFQRAVNVGGTELCHNLIDRLHHHFAVRFALVFQVGCEAREDVARTDFARQTDGGFHELFVVATIERHAPHPKVFEEFWHDFITHILRFHTIRRDTLFHDFQNNFFHFFVRRSKFTYQNDHHFFCVITGVLGVHQRNDVANRFEKRGQTFATMLTNAIP
mmetsp:Transcript_11367/g.19015  ORF Transcript_11367/g.19015 Transcript_11367/m.19015 type:complete len:244 (-) Transcript_11367:1926-2657(-)